MDNKTVMAKALGGQAQEVQATTVIEAQKALGLEGNYTATIDGEPASDDSPLNDNDIVIFTKAVKGGC